MIRWFKSSYSYANSNCVEVAAHPNGSRFVRNSREPGGPILLFTPAEWDAFVAGVKDGEFDRPA